MKMKFYKMHFFLIFIAIMLVFVHKKNQHENDSSQCFTNTLSLKNNVNQLLKGSVSKNQSQCFKFHAVSRQTMTLTTDNKITFLTPSKKVLTLQGTSENLLENTGNYTVVIKADKDIIDYKIEMGLDLKSKNLTSQLSLEYLNRSTSSLNINTIKYQLAYNVATPPRFINNQKLQEIVDDIVIQIKERGLPIERLSVSLVDLSQPQCCAYASYLDDEHRFPASIVKLFWMVALFGEYKAGILQKGKVPYERLYKMIQDSDNNAASFILDQITQTKSGVDLHENELEEWIKKRYSVNLFFNQAGYQNFNITQKPFPITELDMDQPIGRDKQIRGQETQPIRNYVTTYNVARLLFEINSEQSISKNYSIEMKKLLNRDLHPDAWKKKEFNAIQGFLGEYLPSNVHFASKMGWTFSNRNDAAIITSPDGKASYILVIFGDDPSFYKDKTIYPQISQMVYQKMTNEKN